MTWKPSAGGYFETKRVDDNKLRVEAGFKCVSLLAEELGGLDLEEGKETLFINATRGQWCIVDIPLLLWEDEIVLKQEVKQKEVK